MIFKIDFKNAYDHVDWSFLDIVSGRRVLEPSGELGCGVVSDQQISLFFLMGDLKAIFMQQREFGNVICIAFPFSLSGGIRLVTTEVEKNVLNGFKVDKEKIFCCPSMLASSAMTMGCDVSQLSSTYLGLPFSGNPKSHVFWNYVSEKFLK